MALLALQAVHSAIFAASVAFTVWIWVCALRGRADAVSVAGCIWLGAIALALLANNGVCPLQDVARWIVGTEGYVKDMLTPEAFNDLAVPVLAPPAALGVAILGARHVARAIRSRSADS